jgi:hypothetical protein
MCQDLFLTFRFGFSHNSADMLSTVLIPQNQCSLRDLLRPLWLSS